ncbi:MAG: hypothetical protein IPK16_16180, partial [Anaerolineales bacterium]|nr:hypothetical protein [Anaerolineales bacterium]
LCGIGFMMGALALASFVLFLSAGQPLPPLIAAAPFQQAAPIPAPATPLPTPSPELVAAIPVMPLETTAPAAPPEPIEPQPIQPTVAAPAAAPDEPTLPAPVEIVDAPPTEATPPQPAPETPPATEAAPPLVPVEATLPPVVEARPEPELPPTATPSLPPATLPINSGGLGLTRAEWEAKRGSPAEDDGGALVRYGAPETGSYDVSFTEDRVMYVRFDNEQGQDAEFLEAMGASLLPADAQFVNSYSPALTPDMVVRVYKSQSLIEQLGIGCYCWFGGEPGTAIVMYTLVSDPESGERVSNSVTVGTGSSP